MSINILFAAGAKDWEVYKPHLEREFQNRALDFHLGTDIKPSEVDYIIYASTSTLRDFTPFTRCKAVLNLWAGVDTIVGNQSLKIPLARMVDHGLTRGMVEWVAGHVLRYHLGMDRHIINPEQRWEPHIPPLAEERIITLLGLGELGRNCAETLQHLGFQIRGWSRRAKHIENMETYSGEDGLLAALKGADMVVLLLPSTPETENILDKTALSALKKGAYVINPGRGPLIEDEALLAALDSGQIAHATLDVFRNEPLPKEHAFWSHPNVTVTPHIAAATRASCAAPVIAENVQRGEAGTPFLHLVDRTSGY